MKLRARWSRSSAPVVLAGVLALTLSGCGEVGPGTAAEVNGHRITTAQVDDLAKAQCSAVENGPRTGAESTEMALSRVKQQSLSLLMDIQYTKQYAEAEGVEPDRAVADEIYRQFGSMIESMPTATREALAETFKEWATGRAALVQAGARELGQTPDQGNLEQLLNAGLAARQKWLADIDVKTAARYGELKDGYPGGDGSVSRASSTFAKAGGAQEPDPGFVASLPDSQKCG